MSPNASVKTPTELALAYLDIFYSGRDLDELYPILAPDLVFEGPYASYHSASEYVEALLADPPEGMDCRVIRVFHGGDSANVIYELNKGNISTPMSQMFETRDGMITRILLIFDRGVFG